MEDAMMSDLIRAVHPDCIAEALAVGVHSLRRCDRCGVFLAPELWGRTCPQSRWWHRNKAHHIVED